jgi:hypothetical protein
MASQALHPLLRGMQRAEVMSLMCASANGTLLLLLLFFCLCSTGGAGEFTDYYLYITAEQDDHCQSGAVAWALPCLSDDTTNRCALLGWGCELFEQHAHLCGLCGMTWRLSCWTWRSGLRPIRGGQRVVLCWAVQRHFMRALLWWLEVWLAQPCLWC